MDQGENMLLQANISTVILSTLDPTGVLTGRSTKSRDVHEDAHGTVACFDNLFLPKI